MNKLDDDDVDPDPMRQFARWYREAEEGGVPEPEAMTLATAATDGAPSARTVLLKGFDARGFVFFTNYTSRKGRELAANQNAALVFRWAAVGRQICVAGVAGRVSMAESLDYFRSRGRGSQLGAWASTQSEVAASREALDRRLAEVAARFAGADVPLPPFWGGFRLVPSSLELWQNRPDRLHDRIRYRRTTRASATGAGAGAEWVVERLWP